MKSIWIAATLVCLLLAAGAWAQETPRWLGMGGAGIGVADDAVAWLQNPAGLGALNIPVPEGNPWGHDAIGAYGRTDTGWGDKVDVWGITWSGKDAEHQLGIGAGYGDIEDSGQSFGAGFGMNYRDTPFSWGVNVVREEPDSALLDSHTICNVGFMCRFPQPERAPIRVGLVVSDVFSETEVDLPGGSEGGIALDLGVGWPATDRLLVAVDVTDVFGAWADGPNLSGGLEFTAGTNDEWRLRAGALDTGDGHDLTLGAGYVWNNWRVDAGWEDTDAGSFWTVGAGAHF